MGKFKKNHIKLFALLILAAGGNLSSQENNKIHFELTSVWENPSDQPLKDPEAVSASILGDVYIADTGNHRVLKFDSDGKFVTQVGGFGWETNQFDRPLDIFAGDGLNIYVADYNNQRIQRYSKKLEFISSLGNSKINRLSAESNSHNISAVGYPSGVTVSSQGDLFYSDDEKGIITKVNKFGKIENSFGGFAQGRGRLKHPTKLCATKTIVYVVDVDRVVMFDYFGNYIADFGGKILKKPTDVAVGDKERVYVSDSESKTIFVFDKHGAVLSSLLGFSFEKPVSVDVVRNRLYVLDKASLMVFTVFESGD